MELCNVPLKISSIACRALSSQKSLLGGCILHQWSTSIYLLRCCQTGFQCSEKSSDVTVCMFHSEKSSSGDEKSSDVTVPDTAPVEYFHSGNKVHNSSNADPGSQVASHLLKNSCISASNAGNIISDSADQSKNVDCYLVDMIHDTDERRPMEVDGLDSVLAEGKGKSKTVTSGVQAKNYGKMTSVVDQTKVVDSLISERSIESKGGGVGIVNKEQNISSELNKMRNHDHGAIICHSNSNISVNRQSTARYGEQLLAISAAKDKEITPIAVNAIRSKRNKVILQRRDLEDQIANYDKDEQTVLNGGEGSVPLKLELYIEASSQMPLKGNRGNQHGVDHCSCQSAKRKRMSETVDNLQSPCKDLDNVCLENEWMLPTYRVWAQDGGTQANVTLKDMKGEQHAEGDVRPRAREARESAAAKMLSLLAGSPKFTAD